MASRLVLISWHWQRYLQKCCRQWILTRFLVSRNPHSTHCCWVTSSPVINSLTATSVAGVTHHSCPTGSTSLCLSSSGTHILLINYFGSITRFSFRVSAIKSTSLLTSSVSLGLEAWLVASKKTSVRKSGPIHLFLKECEMYAYVNYFISSTHAYKSILHVILTGHKVFNNCSVLTF